MKGALAIPHQGGRQATETPQAQAQAPPTLALDDHLHLGIPPP
jgi:hypothetical protein